jgi:hypothetical protein
MAVADETTTLQAGECAPDGVGIGIDGRGYLAALEGLVVVGGKVGDDLLANRRLGKALVALERIDTHGHDARAYGAARDKSAAILELRQLLDWLQTTQNGRIPASTYTLPCKQWASPCTYSNLCLSISGTGNVVGRFPRPRCASDTPRTMNYRT